MCWLDGFGMVVFRSLQKTIMISKADAAIVGARNVHLAGPVPPFWDPRKRFWQLGGTPGGQGSRRRDTLRCGVGFLAIRGGLRDPILRVVPAFSFKSCVFFMLVTSLLSSDFVVRI